MAIRNRRVIVSIEKLLELIDSKCSEEVEGLVCGAAILHSVKHVGSRVKKLNGRVAKDITTSGNHQNFWSQNITQVFMNDSMLATAIVLSGNNYAKFELICKALNLCIIGKANFQNFQTKCAIPVVKDV